MTDQPKNNLKRELQEAELLETGLDQLFGSLQPPAGASDRLLAMLDGAFHESQLTLDDAGPFSFEQAAAQAQQDADGSDLLAAGLEEQPIDEEQLDGEIDD